MSFLYNLILIRHGQAEHLVGPLVGGWTDTDLTEVGRKQVEMLAARLKKEMCGSQVTILCSDLKRAIHTAEIIGREFNLTPQLAPELRELNNGIAAGMTKDEARRYFREPTHPLVDWEPYLGAETWRQFYHKVAVFMEESLDRFDDSILVVTHGGTIMQIISWWLRLDKVTISNVSFKTDPTSITVLSKSTLDERTIERLNDTAHLYNTDLFKS